MSNMFVKSLTFNQVEKEAGFGKSIEITLVNKNLPISFSFTQSM